MPRICLPVVLLLLVACGGGGAEVGLGESYLSVATSPGQRFRWTPLKGPNIEFFVEIHDSVSELPVGFDSRFSYQQRRDWATEGIDAWMVAASTGYTLDIASHALGQVQPSGQTSIHIYFDQSASGQFRGEVTLYSANSSSVDRVEVRICVPDNGPAYSAGSFQSLLQHELGHALGIIAITPGSGTSHSPFQQDVMFPVAAIFALSQGDGATVDELYSLEPDLVRADSVGSWAGEDWQSQLFALQLGPVTGWLPWGAPQPTPQPVDVLMHVECVH